MVLVIVLWIVTLLAVMAGGFADSMRVETRLATGVVERAQARALAEANLPPEIDPLPPLFRDLAELDAWFATRGVHTVDTAPQLGGGK